MDNQNHNQASADETTPDNDTQDIPIGADDMSPNEAVPLTTPDDEHSTPDVEFHPKSSDTKPEPTPLATKVKDKPAPEDPASLAGDHHPNPVLFSDIPPDNAALADVQTDEDVELKPEPAGAGKKKKWKYRQSMQVLKPVRKKQL